MKTIKGFKGFDKDLKCRGFQFELNKDFEENCEPVLCEKGFHFCENPFDVWNYYPITSSRFAEVESKGETKNHNEDSKIATNKLHIGVELNLKQFIEASFKFIWDKIDWKSPNTASGSYGQAAASGYKGQAAASGDNGQAAASGYNGQAAASGDNGQAAASGSYGQAAASGYNSVAVSTGYAAQAKATKGNWIVLAERNDDYTIKEVKAVLVDGETIKENTFYQLINGKFIEQ